MSIDDEPGPRSDAEERDAPAAVEVVRRRQEAGELADDLDPAFMLLLFEAAASVSVLFPDDVRRATGLDPASPEFAERYADQLRRVVRRLAR